MHLHDPVTGPMLLAYLGEVAEELPADGADRQIVVVGGARLAWLGLRDATRDVDSIVPLDDETAAAAATVGRRHGLGPTWLNSAAAAFIPAGGGGAHSEVILEHPRLRVIGASIDQVLLMKVFAGRATDTPDIRRLWPLSSFRSPEQFVVAFEEAYPHEEPDPHLGDWVARIVR